MKTDDQTTTVLSKLGIKALNKMQREAQKTVGGNKNTILLSPTGSGKTIAYLLPILQLLEKDSKSVQCLIIAPSRELVIQIEQVWKKMGTGYKVNACYGGHDIDVELRNLSNPPALLVGTPGRLTDHLERSSFDPDNIRILVLDEFDKSLELGFLKEMQSIIEQLPGLQKRVLTSATSDIEIPEFVQASNARILDFTEKEHNENLTLKLVLSPEKDKIDTLFRLICSIGAEPILIFCNHREVAERICGLLNDKGISAGYYHGGMDQDDRERVLIRFRNGSLNYLVTTDLAARGLDIPEMKHVIHYHLPSKENEFIHRNGRTARMLASGTAYVVHYSGDKIPDYIPDDTDILNLDKNYSLPDDPEFQTIYISGGKKNKLNKGDIAGFFIQKGNLDKSDIGLIEVKDFISFAAVRSNKIKDLFDRIRNEKMKGKKYKTELARTDVKK